MAKTCSYGPVAALRPIELRLNRLLRTLTKTYSRLAEPDRQRAKRLTAEFIFGKSSTPSHRYPWSKADIERCCLQLQPISQKLANEFRCWASEYRETEHQFRLAFGSLIADLKERTLMRMANGGSRARVPGQAGRVPKRTNFHIHK